MPIRRIDKTLTATTATIAGEDIAASSIPVKPHIQPGVLQPAVAGKLLDGSTSHSGAYGTAQSDGHSYYYTDIKGSKPIKDPRIGAHFGSQRYKFTSLQLLEQETATHGKEVHSIDGRNWIRTVEGNINKWYIESLSFGTRLNVDDNATGMFFEVTGYFNDINLIGQTASDRANDVDITVNGDSASRVDGGTTFDTTVTSPLGGRYVSAGSVINLGEKTALGSSTLKAELGTTPVINTVKIEYMATSIYDRLYGIELIAQDTSSTANKSKIQIPAQNVVSYGKKFALSAAAHHYDPFNGFVNDTTLFSSVVDTATSLGLGTATTWGTPWDKGSNDHIRPFNGGRVVKWVDSSGTIKTSVTMMPANAQNLGTTDSNEITTASATNSHTINFSDDAIDHSLSEVAKTFHIREFGNGAANGNTGATYADASMLNNTVDDIAYVMDDGLTSISGDDVNVLTDMVTFNHDANGDYFYFTFIGTGVGITVTSNGAGTDEYDKYIDGVKIVDGAYARSSGVITQETLAQNLPYGTHILKLERTAVDAWNEGYSEITFYQPKKPPIPEDAVVLADYMLMADFVAQTSAGIGNISKGVRSVSASRDGFYDRTSGNFGTPNTPDPTRWSGFNVEFSTAHAGDRNMLPAFATHGIQMGHDQQNRAMPFYINDTGHSSAVTTTKNGTSGGSYQYYPTATTIGNNIFETFGSSGGSSPNVQGWQFASPIHTSSHYQTFETPFLHELVGGDRNMEQTNLVVTPDGKTWDEVTRDTSYLGHSVCMLVSRDGGTITSDFIFDYFRGNAQKKDHYTKGIAIAYDRFIILEDGTYEFIYHNYNHGADTATFMILNSTTGSVAHGMIVRNDPGDHTVHGSRTLHLKRGDYLKVKVTAGTADGTQVGYNDFQIIKIGS